MYRPEGIFTKNKAFPRKKFYFNVEEKFLSNKSLNGFRLKLERWKKKFKTFRKLTSIGKINQGHKAFHKAATCDFKNEMNAKFIFENGGDPKGTSLDDLPVLKLENKSSLDQEFEESENQEVEGKNIFLSSF